MTTRWFSLRRRLLTLLLGGVSACWLAVLAWTYVDAHHEIDEMFDAQLAQSAQVALALANCEDDDDDGIKEISHNFHRHQSKLMFQIWDKEGELRLRSPNAPTTALTDTDGFSEVRGPQGHWRYLSVRGGHHGRQRVVVAENHAARDELIADIVLRILVPGLAGLAVIGAWVWMATRRGLTPLAALAHQVQARAPERLHAVEPETAPTEIRPLLDALNKLFARVEHALENERRFTADAAHELRTPLAALAAQAQVAQRANDEDERNHALAQLSVGIARAAHLIDQLLTLARLDPERGLASAAAVRLDSLAQEVCAAHGPQALAKDIALELDAEPVEARADGHLLRILLRNLIDNAIRYTPAGGRVNVAVAATGSGARLTVTDSGPGIPAGEHARVFERFSRLAGQEQEGSGLGLSIVRRIADLHAATVTLAQGEGGRGLAVTVAFSPAVSPASGAPPGTS